MRNQRNVVVEPLLIDSLDAALMADPIRIREEDLIPRPPRQVLVFVDPADEEPRTDDAPKVLPATPASIPSATEE